MKNYNELTQEQKELFDKLHAAIQKDEDISGILKSDGIQDVLNTQVFTMHGDKSGFHTFLTYAIWKSHQAVKNILEIEDTKVLEELLSTQSIIKDTDNFGKKHTALSFAQEQNHIDLANTIKQKMREVGLEVPGKEESVAENESSDRTDTNFDDDRNSAPSKEYLSQANDLFWSVLRRDIETASQILDDVSQYTLPAQMFQNGWMKILSISDEKAQELAKEDNETIIKTIQQRQAVGMGVAGNALFWSVLRRDTEAANNSLDNFQYGSEELLAKILQSGWMKTLFIGDKKAQELAEKVSQKNYEGAINIIQKRQAVGMGIGGAPLLMGGILAGIFVNPIFFAAAVIGLAVCAYAAYHGFKEMPNPKMEEVENPVPTEDLQNSLPSM